MKIYNPFKNEVYTSSFSKKSISRFYDNIRTTKIEEIYVKGKKCLFVINDEEIGKKIYKIIKYLKDTGVNIFTRNLSFRISKIVTNWSHDRIFAFYVDFFNQESASTFKSYLVFCPQNNLDGMFPIKKQIELSSFIEFFHRIRILFEYRKV